MAIKTKFHALDTLEATIYHPDFEDGKEPVITLAGPNHSATKKADKDRQAAITAARGRKIDFTKLTKDHSAARIIGWKNTGAFTDDGEELDWSPETALELMHTPDLAFVANQILAKFGDDDSFFKG